MDRLFLKMSLRLLLVAITVTLYSCLASSAVVSRRGSQLNIRSDAGKFPGVDVLCQINRRNCPGGIRKRFSSLEENGSSSLSDVDPSSLSSLLLSGQPWEERDIKERQRLRERLAVLEALQDIVLPPDTFDSRQ